MQVPKVLHFDRWNVTFNGELWMRACIEGCHDCLLYYSKYKVGRMEQLKTFDHAKKQGGGVWKLIPYPLLPMSSVCCICGILVGQKIPSVFSL